MLTRIGESFRRILATFAAFTAGQKTVAVLTLAAVVVGGLYFSRWVSTPDYSPLFTNLASTDASAMVDKLQSGSVQYQLTDGGRTIMVPKDKVYDLRLQMSGAGLPAQDATGYALLDKQGVTTSEFQQQVTYQRALEGELSKTIGSVAGVRNAVVHLAIPKDSVFAKDQQKPTAAVLVDLTPGTELQSQQVQSVVNLVASSVPRLDPAQVTLSDSAGHLLSTAGDQTSGASDARSDATKSYEDRMAANLQMMLDRVVGPGKSVAKVTAQLDFDKTSTKTESFTAKPSTPPLAQSKTTEKYTGNGSSVGGVLGPDNIQVPSGSGAGTSTYTKDSDVSDNAVDKVTEDRSAAPGAVQRLSVAVVVDAAAAKNLPPGQLDQLVSAAAGVDTKRGDTVVVSQLPFDGTATEQAAKDLADQKASAQQAQYLTWARTAGLVLLIALLAFFAWRSSRKTRRSQVTRGELERLDQLTADQLELLTGDTAALGTGDSLALEAGSAADRDRAARREDVAALVEQQPDEVAQVLRSWLAEKE
jgi:flagellar M-ring protein FliF